MIRSCTASLSDRPSIEFDAYTPVTIAWPESALLLDPPIELIYTNGADLLELKFHPDTRLLIEVVVANILLSRRVRAPFDVPSAESLETACWTGGGSPPPVVCDLETVIYSDSIFIGLTPTIATRWVGSVPVLLGFGPAEEFVGILIHDPAAAWDLVDSWPRATLGIGEAPAVSKPTTWTADKGPGTA